MKVIFVSSLGSRPCFCSVPLSPPVWPGCVEQLTRERWQARGGRWLLVTSLGVMVAVIFWG